MLQRLIAGRNLTRGEAKWFFHALFFGSLSSADAQAILVLLSQKVESCDEMEELLRILRSHIRKIPKIRLPFLVDNCGTGGDCSGTFNISTTAAFIAAGAGAFIAKHGNRSISSRVGSSDLLEGLGVNIDASPRVMIRALKTIGLGYFHAPYFHPLLRKVQPLRKAVGVRTIFNIMGPLLNPVGVRRQLIGVSHPKLLDRFATLLARLQVERAVIVFGEPGLDEVSLSGKSHVAEISQNRVKRYFFRPEDIGIVRATLGEMRGGGLKTNVAITQGILKNKIHGAKRRAVLLNAAFTLYASGFTSSIMNGYELADESLRCGRAYRVLEHLRTLTHHE